MGKEKRITKSDVVQVNLAHSKLSESQKSFLQELKIYYETAGYGDGTIHNTLLFILGQTLNLKGFDPFSKADTSGEFILYIPYELNTKIEQFAETFGINKLDAIPTILDIAMKKNDNKRKAQPKNGSETLVNIDNLISIKEFCESSPKSRPLSYPTVRAAAETGQIKIYQIGNNVNSRFIDKTKYYIDANGKIAEYTKKEE